MAAQKKRRTTAKVGEVKVREIALRHVVPEDLPINHADSTNVVHIDGKFYVSFLQMQMPLVSSDEEMSKLREIPTKVVARLLMDEKTLASHIELLDTHLKRVREKLKKAKEADANAGDESTDVRADAAAPTGQADGGE